MKRKAIGILLALMIGITGCAGVENEGSDKQEYAKNAYTLGIVETLSLIIMPPEEAKLVQEKIHNAMEKEISLEEQEKILSDVFDILNKYIAEDQLNNYFL